MAENKGNGITISVIPFYLKSADKKSVLEGLLDNLKYLTRTNLEAHSDYYPDHIKSIWNYNKNIPENEEVGFLQVYKFDTNLIGNNIYIPNKRIDNQVSEYPFKITAVRLIINKKNTYPDMSFGYLIISYQWQEIFQLNQFAASDFFRFHCLEGDQQSKHAFKRIHPQLTNKLNEGLISEKNEEIYLEGIIHDLMRPKVNYERIPSLWEDFRECISFPYNRSYLLHFFHCSPEEAKRDNKKEAYRMIRVPQKDESMALDERFDEFIGSVMINSPLNHSTEFYAMSEGALVNDSGKEFKEKSIINKYFPAFFLALNQREAQLYVASRFIQLKRDENFRYLTEELRKMNGNFVNIRFDQYFKSVSRNTEVDYFFKSIQKVFQVNEILEDNEDKINSLEEIAVVAENKEVEHSERKREARINILLMSIALFSIFSAVTDTYDLFDLNSKWTPHFVWVPIVATLICAYYLLRNQKK